MNNHKKITERIILVSPYDATFTIPFLRAFRKLGFKVEFFDYRTLSGNIQYSKYFLIDLLKTVVNNPSVLTFFSPRKLLNAVLVTQSQRIKPDYLFVIKGESITSSTIEQIKKYRIKTICWQVDSVLHPLIWPFVKKWGKSYDIYVTCEPGKALTHLKKYGFKNVHYMLGAADGENIRYLNKRKEFDVTLVGSYHSDRERFLKVLKDFNLHIWGWGDWQNSNLSKFYKGKALTQTEMLEVYSKSKIIINVGRNPQSTIPTNLRPFEAAQVGAFILVEYKKNLHTVFRLGKEIESFKTTQELRNKIIYYLSNAKAREKIAKEMFNRVKKEHTYEIRLKKLFAELERRRN